MKTKKQKLHFKPPDLNHQDNVEEIEIDLFLETVVRRYGYDFRHYARASLKRRLASLKARCGVRHVAELIPRMLRDEQCFEGYLRDMSVTVTQMFRDPKFFQTFRNQVVPVLRTYPFFKIWHAGCATGEEVYSMAILLAEEGLYDRAQIYATDFNNDSLAKAKAGMYSLEKMKQYTENYNEYGGRRVLSDYYVAKFQSAMINRSLGENISWANHNLVTDGRFGEMHVILCRNVLIYFDRSLQLRVLSLFHDSLCHHGFLGLGTQEAIEFTKARSQFTPMSHEQRIFRKH